VCCMFCSSKLNAWVNRKECSMLFALLMIWRELTDHLTGCFFYMVLPIQKGITWKERWTVEYPNIPLAIHPVPHCAWLNILDPSDSIALDCDEEELNK